MTSLSLRVAGLVLLATAAACSPDSDGSPSSTSATNTVAADGPVRFTQCVRDQGFELPDPPPGAQTVELPARAKTDPAMGAAVDKCRHFLGQGSGKNADDPQQQDRALATARCLRGKGIQVQDPAPGQPLQLNVDAKDPKAMQAVQDCRREVSRQFESGGPTSGG
ncbi:hypothetical protein [Actinokineospora sp. NBRC 105648]|uniref:hypothetical protein n=1 Tax=Actinokineospora sp. NBRC 105648 TaxID=3032206 RepID=UPI0024A5757D|nr:hypothetical protein [Actinokineospora sp. NBRC 105648]GLZ40123.1 hypothetical protein Acsp05_37470 [Actinokineospora sp. NBRC 105648]